MEIIIRGVLWLGLGLFCAALCYYSGSKPAFYFEGRYRLRPSMLSKVFVFIIWLMGFVVFLVFILSKNFELSSKFVLIWGAVALLLALITLPYLTIQYSYDNENLYVDGAFKSYRYEWIDLLKIREYQNLAAGCLMFKFSNKFWWVAVPSEFEGTEQLRFYAQRYVTWSKR